MNINKEILSEAIDNYVIGYKAIRNRSILKDHYIDGLTFAEVAEKYEMSDRQVQKIARDNMKVINQNLKNKR